MNTYTIAKIINSAGLLIDAVGACFVASEVVRKYRGIKFHTDDPTWDSPGQVPQETNEYKIWEKSKYKYMKIGIGLLLLGFAMQIISNWINYIF